MTVTAFFDPAQPGKSMRSIIQRVATGPELSQDLSLAEARFGMSAILGREVDEVQARVDAMRAQGLDAFMAYQLPHAVIALKQGVGRLIRDVSDRGVLVLCDPRLDARGYGKAFLDSLPAMRLTRTLADVEAFFADG